MSDTVRQRVANGALLLDDMKPGWQESVNVSCLDITSATLCVLGQVYGTYWVGEDTLGLNDDSADAYAFSVDSREEDAVNDAWKDYLYSHASPAPAPYSEATLLSMLAAGVTVDEFTAYLKVQKVLSK